MADFDDVVMPGSFAYGAIGGIGFNTQVSIMRNKREQRNQNWEGEQAKYDLHYPIKQPGAIDTFQNFVRLRNGKARGFLFDDPLNNNTAGIGGTPTKSDQLIGVGDGTTTDFQLKLTWTDAFNTVDYIVYKPQIPTVLIAVGGTLKTVGTDYDIQPLGLIRFKGGHIPSSGNITWGGLYYRPVRFDSDQLQISYDEFNAFEIVSMPMMEITPES